METIPVSAQYKTALEASAQQQGKELVDVAEEALAAYLDYQGWADDAREKIEVGWAQSERCEVVDGDVARRRLDAKHAALLGRKSAG